MRELTRPIHAAMHHVARAQIRIPSFGRATLRRDGAADLRIRIGNISRSGFMGETKGLAPVRAGQTVELVLPFGRVVRGTVRWSLNGRFGCQLDGAFRGRDMLAISLLAGARVSSLVLLAFLAAALWL
jgi:hypothetical protein